MSHDREKTPVGPFDPDAVLITRYLAEALTPEEKRVVEDRLLEDDDFRIKAIPLGALWHLYDDIPGDTVEEVFEAFEAAAAARRASQTALTAPAPKLIPATPPALTATRRWWAWVSGGARVAVAVIRRSRGKLFFGFVGLALAVYNYNKWQSPPAPAPAFAPAASATGGASGGGGGGAAKPAPGRLRIAAGVPRIDVPADSGARSVELHVGLRLVLPPGSALGVKPVGDSSTYNLGFDGGGRGADVSIEVAEPMVTVNFTTGSGHMTLKRGRYTLHVAGGDSAEMQLTVIAGKAAAYGRGNNAPRFVDPGERAFIHIGERPSIVPAPTPAARPPQP